MGKLYWLASYPKSGNTWIRYFLQVYFLSLAEGRLVADGLERMREMSTTDVLPAWYRDDLGPDEARWPRAEVLQARPRALARIQASTGGNVLVKTHGARVQVDGQPLIDPSVTAGAVYIVRNPLDVAVSFARHFGLPVLQSIRTMANLSELGREPGKAVPILLHDWSAHVRSWVAAAPFPLHFLRYEDLLARPQQEFAGLVRFFGHQPDDALLDGAIEAASFGRLSRLEREGGFREAPRADVPFFSKGQADQWLTGLTRTQAKIVLRDHGEAMSLVGYDVAAASAALASPRKRLAAG
jgi:hypothetical protein